jgi:hypothetical protein
MHRPRRISIAYITETLSAEARAETVICRSRGWISRTYTSLVSQAGRADGFQAAFAAACLRCVSERLSWASALCEAIRRRAPTLTAVVSMGRRNTTFEVYLHEFQRLNSFAIFINPGSEVHQAG